jgi:uncharacterized protein
MIATHSPPWGVADRQKDGRHDGSKALRDAVLIRQPRLMICGHIHQGWGQTGSIGTTPIHNIGPCPRSFAV